MKSKRDKNTFTGSLPEESIVSQFPSTLGLNAIAVGNAIFCLEQIARSRKIRKLVVPIYRSSRVQYNLDHLKNLLHDLIVFTLVEDVEIDFKESRRDEQQSLWDAPQVKNICLFSGGVDSYAGILLSKQVLGSVEGAFCAHNDQARIIHIVAELQKTIMGPKRLNVSKIAVPPMGARGYAQIRGFLYLLSAGALVDKLGARSIVVTECGPTMYQPRFSPLDSITMTTNPYVVAKAKTVLSFLLGRDIKIITPFENLTKAEVVAICPSKKGLKHTHSCISQRFGTHDGTCYGCIIRRLATTAAGVADVPYDKNPIGDSKAKSGNLYSLLSFSAEILTQYNKMDEFEIGTIEAYQKKNLFRRFALDNFAAIFRLLSEKRQVVKPIRDMFARVDSKLAKGALEKRLSELANPTVKPNFTKGI